MTMTTNQQLMEFDEVNGPFEAAREKAKEAARQKGKEEEEEAVVGVSFSMRNKYIVDLARDLL